MKDTEQFYPLIKTWVRYNIFSDREDINNQVKNLLDLPLYNGLGQIKFVYTKGIDAVNKEIEKLSSKIKIVNTKTTIEDEVYFTSKIEGAKTTRIRTSELHNGAKINDYDRFSELMVKNAFEAVKMLNLYGNRLNRENLIKVWNVLTDGCRENSSVQGNEYRNGDIFVGNFKGADAKDIPELMDKWLEFYNGRTLDSYPFIKACILHYSFETIHPFCDGNGRMGRLLMNNYLISRGIESSRAVSFSMQIDKERNRYDLSFVDSENIYNDCTPFVENMLNCMYNAYEEAERVQNMSKKKNYDLDFDR